MKKPTFADLMQQIEAEAQQEGPEAVAQLERMRHRYYLGGQLAVLRKRRGITQIELAAQSGVEQADISKIERGISNPTEDTLARLGKVLGARLAFVTGTSVTTPLRTEIRPRVLEVGRKVISRNRRTLDRLAK